jgi:hypothetical protein
MREDRDSIEIGQGQCDHVDPVTVLWMLQPARRTRRVVELLVMGLPSTEAIGRVVHYRQPVGPCPQRIDIGEVPGASAANDVEVRDQVVRACSLDDKPRGSAEQCLSVHRTDQQ